MSHVRAAILLALMPVLTACPRVVLPPPLLPADAVDQAVCEGRTRRTDEFVTSGSTKVDVLLVVDTGEGSESLLAQRPTLTLSQVPGAERASRERCPHAPGLLCVEVQSADGRVEFLEGVEVTADHGQPRLALQDVLPGSPTVFNWQPVRGSPRVHQGQCVTSSLGPAIPRGRARGINIVQQRAGVTVKPERAHHLPEDSVEIVCGAGTRLIPAPSRKGVRPH